MDPEASEAGGGGDRADASHGNGSTSEGEPVGAPPGILALEHDRPARSEERRSTMRRLTQVCTSDRAPRSEKLSRNRIEQEDKKTGSTEYY
jgi:hypothetical protein